MWNHPHIHIVDVWVFTISIWHGNPSFCSEYSTSRHWIMTWDFQDDSCCLLSTERQKQAAFQNPRNWAAGDFFLSFFGPKKAHSVPHTFQDLYCIVQRRVRHSSNSPDDLVEVIVSENPRPRSSFWEEKKKKEEFHREATPSFDYRADYFVQNRGFWMLP